MTTSREHRSPASLRKEFSPRGVDEQPIRKPTMRDVARLADVSPKTVSRVLNEDLHVSPETRNRVERVMAELEYIPNTAAQAFRTGKSSVIGVAVPDVVDPFFAAIVGAVDAFARQRGYSTLVTSLGNDLANERLILESLLSRNPVGLVVAPIGTDYAWLRKWQARQPVVFVDRAPPRLAVDSFTDDDFGGAYAAIRHLLDRGQRRIAYVGDKIHLSTEINRHAGYQRALADAHIPVDASLFRALVGDEAAARTALGELRAMPDPPDAIFASNAKTSMSLFAALGDEAIPLVGFGDFPLAHLLRPSLTVVDQSPGRLGRLAAERILDRIDKPRKRFRRRTVLRVELIVRESSLL